MVVSRIEELHKRVDLPLRETCEAVGVPYSSVMRWKERMTRGWAAVNKPGPEKVRALDLEALHSHIRALAHKRKRTHGTGELYRKNRDKISRRDLGRLIAEERQRRNLERNQIYHRVAWNVTRLIWAIDDTEYHPDKAYPKAYLHNVQDLGSRYKFEPLVGLGLAHGDEVAAHLCDLFEMHGPPLFLKRDNGSNLNHHIVEELLAAFLVIPVNSPCYYPQYNGSIEVANREIKHRLSHRSQLPSAFLAIEAELDVQALNHKRRACLGHKTSCQAFCAGEALARKYNRRKRKEVYDVIKGNTIRLIEECGLDADKAWRLAVEKWLLDNHFITVLNRRWCYPI